MKENSRIENPSGANNYMLDTKAYNEFDENPKLLAYAIQSLDYGFRYYKTDTQDWELNGFGAKVYDINCQPVRYNPNVKLPDYKGIDERLRVKYVSTAVNLMSYHTLLDGSAHLINSESKAGEMFYEILSLIKTSDRKKRPFSQHYDAFIAEATIHNNCILITGDTALRNTVNKYFPDRAITMEMLIEKIEKALKGGADYDQL